MSTIIIFFNTSSVFYAERALKLQGILPEIIPTPKDLSSDCGIALKMPSAINEKAVELITKQGIKIQGVFKKED